MTRAMIASVLICGCAGCETASTISASESGAFGEGAVASPSRFVAESQMDAEKRQAPVEPTPLAPPAADASPATTQAVARLVVYSASLRLVVASTADAMASVQRLADGVGGYLQESDARSITVRVPADRFTESLASIGALGEVVERAMKAADVGEQMFDLDTRLDNARKTRERLAAHLAKSEKMADTIALEAELSRVTTQIEELEGKRRLLASQIAMSTIRVELNGSRPQTPGGVAAQSPFAWIGGLGGGLVAGTAEAMPRQPQFLAGGPRFDPPAGFVRYYSGPDLVEAMNADGVRLKVARHANFDRGPLAFWQTLARRSLVETRSLAVSAEGLLAEDANWSRVVGTRDVGGKAMGYALFLSRTNDDVLTVEAWGPRERVDALLPTLTKSARSVKR